MNSGTDKPDVAAVLYQGTSGREYHALQFALRPEAEPWMMSLRAEKLQPHVRAADVVFELGVGPGWNLAKLRCARRIGCDASEFLAEQAAALGIEFVADLAAVPDGIADIAICHHTLEHLLEPAWALSQIARILKPGGKLLLYVPWQSERKSGQYRTDEPDHHLYTWSPQNIGNLAAVVGYGIQSIRVRRFGYDRFLANTVLRFGAGEQVFRLIRPCVLALSPHREVQLVALKPATGTADKTAPV